MKRFRLLLLGAGGLIVLLGVAAIVLFNGSFQTAMARRALAGQTGFKATLGSISVGWKHVEAKELRFERAGVVLTLPTVAIDLPVTSAAWGGELRVSRLVAKGWTLDWSKAEESRVSPVPGRAGPPRAVTVPATPPDSPPASAKPDAADAVLQAFAGVFRQLDLPADVAFDGVELEGQIVLPASRGVLQVRLAGGGLGAGREGKFNLQAKAALTDESVRHVDITGDLVAAMDTPRSFTRLAARLDAAANGTRFPQGVKLHADVAAAREPRGETYSAAVVTEGQEILKMNAEFPHGAPKLGGTWKLNVRDVDVVPFALGKPLPAFALQGEGAFDADATFTAIHVLGRLDAGVDRLHVLWENLSAVGELKITADFDLANRAGTLDVRKFEVAARGPAAQPVATVRTLQAFDFNPATGELHTADTSLELLGLALQGVPVDWIRPLVPGVRLTGGRLKGEFAASARDGGITLRATSPLTVDGLSLAQAGAELVQGIDLSFRASAGYTPKGWQADVTELTARHAGADLLSLDIRLGQLAGRGQAVKAAGRLGANLPVLLAQPALAGSVGLKQGEAAVEFAASLDGKKEVQATIALKQLAAEVDGKPVALPALSTHLRADFAADGAIAFNAPVTLEHGDRKSDVTFVGTLAPGKSRARAIDAELTSTQLFVDDAKLFSALATAKSAPPPPAARPAAPPWAGLEGAVTLNLKQVVYSDVLQIRNLTGRLRLDGGIAKLEDVQAGVSESGRANLSGSVTFEAGAAEPYVLAADLGVRDFNPGPFFTARGGAENATIEGQFDFTRKLAGRAMTLAGVISEAQGDIHVTSKGGVFRGLPVSVSTITETTSRWTAWLVSASSAISSMIGKKDLADVTSKGEAVAEIARALHPIPYDQLGFVISRDADRTAALRDFTLISPELRLSGSGTAVHQAGGSVFDDGLSLEFTLRARGRQGDLLKYLGALEPQTDDLGYAACTVPLKVGGTVSKPDTTELNSRLSALAIEKSGFSEKAAEFLSKIRGGK